MALRGLIGQGLRFAGDHRKSPAMLAGARGFDRGVQGQQVGLARDALDQRHDFADLLGAAGEALDDRVGAAGFVRRLPGDCSRAGRLLPDLADRGGELFGCRRHGADIERSLRRGRGGRRGCSAASSLLRLIDEDMPCISPAATETAWTIWPTYLRIPWRACAWRRRVPAGPDALPHCVGGARASAAFAASVSAVFCAAI